MENRFTEAMINDGGFGTKNYTNTFFSLEYQPPILSQNSIGESVLLFPIWNWKIYKYIFFVNNIFWHPYTPHMSLMEIARQNETFFHKL